LKLPLAAVLLLSLALPQALAQTPKLLTSADLLTDAATLRQAYEQLHPGLYRYNTKPEMDAKFEALQKTLSHDQSLRDAYLAFSVFAAQVKCGHTYANFFNQTKANAEALFQGPNRVPFYFRWQDRKMIVTRDFTPSLQIPRGTEILSLNGTPASAILTRLLTVARADGSNDAKRIAYLAVSGDSLYEAFDIYFPLFFPQPSPALKLTVKTPGRTAPQTLQVDALTYAQRIAPIQGREAARTGGNAVLFDWKYLPNGTALLSMPTWALYQSKWDWKTWLTTRLDELAAKNPPALIIDLRGNEGGLDAGDQIIERLVRKDLRVLTYRRLVRYRQTPAELNPYLETWDPSFRNWGTAAAELAQPWPTAPPAPYFTLNRTDDDNSGAQVFHPSAKPYLGKVYVLIDANNSSATFQFAGIIQKNRLGTLVGEPTGGNQRGINGGAFFFLRLPKSKIELDLPLIGYFPQSPQPDAGLTPDIRVSPTLQDIIQGTDAALRKLPLPGR
jgi:hypothetical protein